MTKIKICGISTFEAGLAALDAGADYLGFMFYAPSPRFIVPQAAAALIGELRSARPRGWEAVGVFVNEPLESLTAVIDVAGLDVVQCSGDESSDYVRAVPRPVFKAVRFAAGGATATSYGAARLLIDANVAGSYGGTGVAYDWRSVRGAVAEGLLAGGLTPDNVSNAIAVARPWGVDVSSGVEVAPGAKSPELIRSFIAAVRTADAMAEELRAAAPEAHPLPPRGRGLGRGGVPSADDAEALAAHRPEEGAP